MIRHLGDARQPRVDLGPPSAPWNLRPGGRLLSVPDPNQRQTMGWGSALRLPAVPRRKDLGDCCGVDATPTDLHRQSYKGADHLVTEGTGCNPERKQPIAALTPLGKVEPALRAPIS